MERSDAIKILAKVKANWYRQPTDDITAAEWADCLVRVSYVAAAHAVDVYRDRGDENPPTPGQIYHLAAERERQIRDARPKLEPPDLSPEELARGRQMLRDFIARATPKAAYSDQKKLPCPVKGCTESRWSQKWLDYHVEKEHSGALTRMEDGR